MLGTVGFVVINRNQKWTFMHKNNNGLSYLFKSSKSIFFYSIEGLLNLTIEYDGEYIDVYQIWYAQEKYCEFFSIHKFHYPLV